MSGWDAYTLHKSRRIRFPQRKMYSKGIADLYQIDLVDVSSLSVQRRHAIPAHLHRRVYETRLGCARLNKVGSQRQWYMRVYHTITLKGNSLAYPRYTTAVNIWIFPVSVPYFKTVFGALCKEGNICASKTTTSVAAIRSVSYTHLTLPTNREV